MSEKSDSVSVKSENDVYLRRAENFRLFLMVALSVVIYAFIYFQVTTIIEKTREMDRITEVTADLTRRMNRLSELDFNMSATLEKLRDSYTRRMAIVQQAEENCFRTE